MNRFSLAMLFSLCVGSTCPSWAAVVYSQVAPTVPNGAFSSNDKLITQKVADNFRLAGQGSITVRSIRLIGGYGLTDPPPIAPLLGSLPVDGFRVTFFENENDSPGSMIPGGDFAVGPASARSPTSETLLNGVYDPLEYRIDLGQGVTLNSSTAYWISVTNTPGVDHFWTWARSTGILDEQTATTFGDISTGSWTTFTNGGMWFELSDQAVVPEPSTAVLLIVAVALLVMDWFPGSCLGT